MPLRAIEFFCGIGGFAAAVAGPDLQVVAALDQSPAALAVYRLNFPDHPAREINLEHLQGTDLPAADLWWLSPPCQPYCARGDFRDLADPRAASLLRLLDLLDILSEERLPVHLALENVEGFARSQGRRRLLEILGSRGYQVRERRLCPTELGVPMRRPRYYLAASRRPLRPAEPAAVFSQRPLAGYLDPPAVPRDELYLPREVIARFGDGLRLLEPAAPAAYATCFTAGYGRSLMHAGAYLQEGSQVRRFSPAEIARLLGFPAGFRFPPALPLRKRWQLLGNSLSVDAVREILKHFAADGPPFR